MRRGHSGSGRRAGGARCPAPPKALKCPACGSKIEPSWTSCPICLTALVPEKGYTPEAPKKVIKVVKKVVKNDEEPETPPGEDKAPKKPVIVTKEGEKK